MKKNTKLAIGGGAGAVLVATLLLFGMDDGDAMADAGAMETAAAELRDLEIRVEATGTVEAVTTVEVKSRASGEVRQVFVESGDFVQRGMLLTEIDPRDVRNAYAQAEADLQSARVRLNTTEAQLKRVEELREAKAATQQEYEAALDAAAAARTAVVRGRTNLELAQERLGDVAIRAPISGTVIERTVEPGQIIASATGNVSGGTTLMRLANLEEIRVRMLVDETDIGRLTPGQAAQVSVEAYPTRTFRGVLEKIEPLAIIDQNVTMFPVLVRLPNPGSVLKPGMNAEVVIDIARRDGAVTVPNGAITGMRDARDVAEALGLGEDALEAALRPARPTAPATEGAAVDCRVLFMKMREGGGRDALSDAERTQLAECRQQRGSRERQGGGAQEQPDQRPGVVFVQTAGGIEPRRVTVGLSDWEYTEIVEGLKAGERVVLVSVAQLQQQQQQMAERMRERTGGGMFGGSSSSSTSTNSNARPQGGGR